MTRPSLRSWLLVLCLVALSVTGCRDDRRHQASEISALEVAKDVVPNNASPTDVARALLTRLARAQSARGRGLGVEANRDEYSKTMAEVRGLAARKAIFDIYRTRGGSHVPVDLKQEGAVRVVTDSWVSICAFYSPSLDTAALSIATADTQSATVFADVVAPTDQARAASTSQPSNGALDEAQRLDLASKGLSPRPETRIVIRMAMDEAQAWRALRVDLEPFTTSMVGRANIAIPAATQPAQPPATRPAN